MFNAAGALLAFSMSLETGASWPRLWRILAISFVYANCLGTLGALAMPRLLRRYGGRSHTALWTVRIVGLLVLIPVGISIGATVLLLVGLIDARDYHAYAFPSRWPLYAIPTIIVVGLGIALYEGMREELEATTLALRTKERDEAVARHAATEAQLASLESRVEPHFLFNTLNSIAELIHHDPIGAERMVVQLASLLRSSLDHDSVRLVPLGDELRVVLDYLDIEGVRLGSRLRYDVHVADDVATVPVPPLSVQTLVENAVKYAVAPRAVGASVTISASADNGRARVEVNDDGPGFSPEAIVNGHGLALLRSRLSMQFGDRASLRIDSRPGKTSVAMELPAAPLPR